MIGRAQLLISAPLYAFSKFSHPPFPGALEISVLALSGPGCSVLKIMCAILNTLVPHIMY